jgi:GINS complex subunit 2
MSGLSLRSLASAENEFLAEETLVTIVSGVDHPALNFISGRFGPLQAGFPAEVPLWLAITLRKRRKCTIVIPEWMSIPSLEQFITSERSQGVFAPLPFYYREISQLLLTHAREDFPASPDKVSVLLKDLEGIRMDRAKMGMLDMADRVRGGDAVLSAGLLNVGAIEIQTIRRFFVESMSMFRRLTMADEAPQGYMQASAAARADDDDEGASGSAPTAGRKQLRKFRT